MAGSTTRAIVLARAATALAVLLAATAPSTARAYQSPMRFGEPSETGGGGGRFFTGSALDNYTCKVCHTGGRSPLVQISGLPLDGYVPGQIYRIAIDWDDHLDSVALNFEVTDGAGASIGTLTVPELSQLGTADLCEPVEAGRPDVLLLPPMAAGRPIALVAECGSHRASVDWTAPVAAPASTDIWLVGSVVASDSDGTVAGDGVSDFARVFGKRQSGERTATVVKADCRVHEGGAPAQGGPWVVVLAAIAVLFARRGARRRRRRSAGRSGVAASAIGALLVIVLASLVRADSLSSAVYVRNDSDETLVVSPRAHAQKRIEDATQVDVSYAADVWTSASIDIRTSASKPVTEQRDELDVGASHELEDITLNGSYRLSIENDYSSNGGSAGGSYDFADNNATVDLNLGVFQDSVGKSGEPKFSRGLTTVNTRLSFTQVLTSDMISQVTYEVAHLAGYQASPYRVVGIGGTGYGCMGAFECLPEHQPDRRTRHALAANLRGALSSDLSLGGNYRFYMDDWGLRSHTLLAQLGWMGSPHTLVTLRYRFYTQNGARFYQAVYSMLPDAGQYTTRDREQSPMHDHRIGADLQQKIEADDQGLMLVLNAGVGVDFYAYDDFVGLDKVTAFELVFGVGFEK